MGSETIKRGTGIALWRQIYQAVEEDIASGGHKPGDRLPTEHELAQRFGVNRHTVRQALGALEEAGLIRVEQGRGTFVQEQVIDYQVSKRTRFSQELTGQSRVPSKRLLGAREEQADATVAKALSIRKGTWVVRLDSTGYADGRCIVVASAYFVRDRFKGIDKLYEETGSITKSLKAFGVEDYTRKWTHVLARMPSTADAGVLKQPKNRPVLVTESLNVDPAGTPLEFSVTRWASDWVQIVFES